MATPVTFILAGHRLVTVRYAEPRAFEIFLSRAQKKDAACMSGAGRPGRPARSHHRPRGGPRRAHPGRGRQAVADHLRRARAASARASLRFDVNIRAIGHEGELTSRSRESLLTLDRLLTYLAHVMSERGDDKALKARVKTANRDVQSLADHIGYLSTKITFLLDATLGMINNEQNSIIKIFSVLAVVLMPPTLVGTIYGMNFKHMPELEWIYGYPLALGLMVLSALLPLALLQAQGLAVSRSPGRPRSSRQRMPGQRQGAADGERRQMPRCSTNSSTTATPDSSSAGQEMEARSGT